ncbi:MAG: KipI antagonist, partial [Desulfobacula sp.]
MTHLIIHTPGLLTTLQDQGRYGYQRFGMPVAGAMDEFSMALCNLLVGNSPGAACMEATLTGPEIIFSSFGAVAVSGADMGPCINGKPVSLWTTIEVRKDDRLCFTGLKTGCRTYIAFAGGIHVPRVMNSRSTYLRARLGGFEGRALKPGDKIL